MRSKKSWNNTSKIPTGSLPLPAALLSALILLQGCLSASRIPEETTKPPKEEYPGTSLPSLEEESAPLDVPSPEPAVPEVSSYEAVRQLHRLFPSHLEPAIIRGRFPMLLHDMNLDDYPEGFSLGIPASGLKPEQIDRLSDYSRLFEEKEEAVPFYLLCFDNQDGRFYRTGIFYLGSWQVFEGLRMIPLRRGRSKPIIISVSFHTLEGTEQQLYVFEHPKGEPLFHTLLKNTLSTKAELEDIDEDGLIDLLVKKRGMEEGMGYETFITRYRWNGRVFAETATINVVRNLKTFLSRVEELILAGDIRNLLRRSAHPDLAARLRAGGKSDAEILSACLGLRLDSEGSLPEIREVVFPEILEDPFSSKDRLGYSFPISYRIVERDGASYIAEALLYMLRNPFGERQFAFYPD